MSKEYQYAVRNVYNVKGPLYSAVDEEILNAMAEEGWELMQVIPPANAGLSHKYTEAIFRKK
jgi:hypothetical protein